MRIALVTGKDYYPPTGVVGYTRGLAEALSARGHIVSVLVVKPYSLHANDRYFLGNDNLYEVYLLPKRESIMAAAEDVHWWLLHNLQDVVEAYQYDARLLVEQIVGGTPTVVRYESDLLDRVHNGGVPFDYEGLDVASRQVAWSLHLLEMNTLKKADLVVSTSVKHLVRVQNLGQEETMLLPVGVDKIISVNAVSSPQKRVVIMVGRFIDVGSGFEYVASIVNAIPTGYDIDIVGSGSEEEVDCCSRGIVDKTKFVSESTMTQKVSWHRKSLNICELEQLYCDSTAVIVPMKSNTFSHVLVKPMCFGRPVITFDLELDSSWPVWRMGSWDDPNVFESISNMLKLADELDAAGVKTLLDFARKFLWSELIGRYEEAYNRAICRSITRGRVRSW